MAIRPQNVSLDFLKVGIIKDVLQNPLTTAQKNTLAGTLGTGNKGLAVYDTDLNLLQHWNGTAFTAPAGAQSGLTPKGTVTFNAVEPTTPNIGDLYVFSNAGTNTWTGVNQVVQASDQAWWDGTVWQVIQGNVVAASDSVAGIIRKATQAEVNTGTEADSVVTPATLKANNDARKSAKVYFASSVSLTADTPFTVAHALALQHRDAFVLSFKVGNSEVMLDVDSTDVNNCTVTSNVAVTGTVTVIGF